MKVNSRLEDESMSARGRERELERGERLREREGQRRLQKHLFADLLPLAPLISVTAHQIPESVMLTGDEHPIPALTGWDGAR